MSNLTGTDHEDDDEATIDQLASRLGVDRTLISLGEATSEQPPPDARRRLLGELARRPRQLVDPLPPAELYRSRAQAWLQLLQDLVDADWSLPARPYDWTVRELVAHVTVIEEYTSRQFGLGEMPPLAADDPSTRDHLGMGGDERFRLATASSAEMVARWRAASGRIAAHTTSPGFDPEQSVPLHGWPFHAPSALTVRAFELWTHADDIRRATGRPLDELQPGELRAMSSASVMSLPLLLPLVSDRPLTPTRIVLTGPGGGTFDLGEGEPSSRLVADVVEYCRVVARRHDPRQLGVERHGDAAVVDALLRASQTIAI
jgi:uncharacterized protein (TIGR03083 family)